MGKNITMTLNEDEAEIILDALEADLEVYVESAKEARGNNRGEEVRTFTEAADRIAAVRDRLRNAVD